jgi:hypothetical protein
MLRRSWSYGGYVVSLSPSRRDRVFDLSIPVGMLAGIGAVALADASAVGAFGLAIGALALVAIVVIGVSERTPPPGEENSLWLAGLFACSNAALMSIACTRIASDVPGSGLKVFSLTSAAASVLSGFVYVGTHWRDERRRS